MKNILFTTAAALLASVALAQAPQITMGNGEANWIITEGASRDGSTFVFREAHIAGNGWLVMHPFENGRPNGKVVAGFSPLPDGTSKEVAITVDPAPAAGDRYIVMLHADANSNGEFDFVFVNEREVVDAAVFEGSTMIGHVFVTP